MGNIAKCNLINLSKCEFLAITNKKFIPSFTYHINNVPGYKSPAVQHAKYLGVTMHKLKVNVEGIKITTHYKQTQHLHSYVVI